MPVACVEPTAVQPRLPAPPSVPSGPSSLFFQGCRDALPVCVTFMFLFSSLGTAARQGGFSLLQAGVMTLTVHAAPLQALLIQRAESLGFMAVLAATLLVNFRFVILSSALSDTFRQVSLWRALLSIQLLSVSTFTLANARQPHGGDVHGYYLGCGISTLACAVLATVIGHCLGGTPSPRVVELLSLLVPIHFTALACLGGRHSRVLHGTAAGFVLTPAMEPLVGGLQILVVPLLIAGVMTLRDSVPARRSA